MPAKSAKQQKFFGIVKGMKAGEIVKSYSAKAARVAKTMKAKAIRHFAKTKRAGLPERKKKSNLGLNNTNNTNNATKEVYPSLPVVVGKIRERQKKRRKIMGELFP